MYDYNDPVFSMRREFVRWAKEHELLQKLRSAVIRWEVVETVSPLKIPVRYRIHYNFKSIIGIDTDRNPIYGDHHIAEIEIPPNYPMETCKAFMVTDTWHPNIVSKGKDKGRICTQSEKFGTLYELPQLVLRIGEILQYRNYLAEMVDPYPFDLEVAKWVREYAEPNNIINQKNEVYVDSSPLLSETVEAAPELSKKIIIKNVKRV